MKRVRAVATALGVFFILASAHAAKAAPPVSIPDRARGADQVVVATVSDLTSTFERNAYGDELIVSHVRLQVKEHLKGERANLLDVDVEGGTIGDVSMDVSSMPRVMKGNRAVFFLEKDQRTGRLVPHLKGEGILMLDANDRVEGTSLDLNTVRSQVASAAAR